MNTKNENLYEAPATTVVEVKTEGIVCSSSVQSSVQNYTWHDEVEE